MTNKIELDDLIEEFLNYCDLQGSGAISVGLSSIPVMTLTREERRRIVEECINLLIMGKVDK